MPRQTTKPMLRAILRASLWLAGTVVIVFVSAIGLISYFAEGMCRNEIIADYPSPETTRRVVVFQRDCGATTGYSTQASILDIGEALDNAVGNVFVAVDNRGSAPAGQAGGPALFVMWQDDRSVLMSFDPRARVFKNEPRLDGIGIAYDRSIQPKGRPKHPKHVGPAAIQ